MNRVLTETQPGNRTVTNVYYENGLLKHTSGYGVYPQEYTYENGRKVSMTTWQDEDTPAVTSWSYDLSGRLTAKTYADNSATTYTYGANGKLSRRTWANGVKTDYTYDGAGRLTGVNYSDDTPDVSYVYDRRGRTVQITDGSGTRNLAYNDDNSLKYEELPYFSSYRLEKEYDALGRLTKTGLKQPNGDNWAYAVSYTYDAMSRLATLSQGGKTLTYSRLANSDRLDKAEFSPASAAPAVEYSYDTKLRLISKGCGTRSFTDKDEVWYFDCPAGTPGNWGTSRYYSYDSMGQLTLAGEGVMGPDGQVDNPQNFSYDSIGNHLTNNETYSILNQGSGKTYDANGNMTRNGDDWIALYDGENRLRTVSHPYDGVELLYDYAGRIYQVNDFYMDGGLPPTSTLNYRRIYDGTKLIATVRNGAIEDTFVWQPETSGDADVILWDKNYVYATDPNKNVRVKRFPNDWIPGTWVEEFIDYKPFGELKNYVANPPRFMFSSEEYMPETGMYHYLYRAYSPSLARFITRDPIEEQGGVNLYCFVNNNPVSYWDENGLDIASSIINSIKKGANKVKDTIIDGIEAANPYIVSGIERVEDKIGMRIPRPPRPTAHQADWFDMVINWFFELGPNPAIYSKDSPQSIDIANSYSMKTVLEAYCKDKEAPKEWKFDGPGTATGEYGEVEWFLGSYDIENFSLKNGVARFEVHNTSGWHSATRLPKTWQEAIKSRTGVDISHIKSDIPRGTMAKAKRYWSNIEEYIPNTPWFSANDMINAVPSFGGNWDQIYYIEMQWCCPDNN